MENDEDFIPFDDSIRISVAVNSKVPKNVPVLLNQLKAPWLAQIADPICDSPFVQLHNEMIIFTKYITPTERECSFRKLVLDEITNIIKDLFPESTVHVFGSQLTKILTPTSDLDLAVLNVPEEDANPTSHLHKIANAIKSKRIASYVEVIESAKIPIVKYDHKAYGISVDICFNSTSGMETGALVRKYMRQYPPLKILTVVLKIFLGQRKLNETYSGGIGSFVLTIMIISFLQMKQQLAIHQKIPLTSSSWNLAVLLVDFLKLYGCDFNYVHTGISIREGGFYFPRRLRGSDWNNPSRPNLLSIENPLVIDWDMGKNSFMVAKVKRAFEHAYQLLSSAMSHKNTNCHSYLIYLIRGDDPQLMKRISTPPNIDTERSINKSNNSTNSGNYSNSNTNSSSNAGKSEVNIMDLTEDNESDADEKPQLISSSALSCGRSENSNVMTNKNSKKRKFTK